jgi:flagellar motor switch protein FliG
MGEPSLSSTLTMVKKISASLILDKSVTEDDARLARKLAGGLLGLPADRQDLITVEKMDFRKAKPLTLADLFLPPNLWSLVWVLVVALVAILTVFAFLSPLSKSARAFVEAFSARTAAASSEREARRDEAPRETAAEKAAERAVPQPGIDGRKPPFWFLNAGHASSLAFILKTRTAEDITIVLNYAPQDLAAKLAEALYPRSVEALAALPRVKLMEESQIKALETEILSALDYVVGGEEKALEILNGLNEGVQEKAISAFSRLDPALSRKLNASIVKLADLAVLDPQQALMLARRLPMRVLAAALKGSPHAETFLSRLSGGMQERFRQELDLTRLPAGEGYKEERAKVLAALRQLIKEGFITLGAAAPKPPPAAAKPAAAPVSGLKPAAAPAMAARPAAAPKPAAAKPAPAPAPAPKP